MNLRQQTIWGSLLIGGLWLVIVWSLFSQPGSHRQIGYAAPLEVKILLVDDDDSNTNNGNTDFRSYYTEVLNSLSADYDVHDVSGGDGEVTEAILSSYSQVVWFSSWAFGPPLNPKAGPTAAEEVSLASWLSAADNCLFISSQDYLDDRGGITPFMSSHLGVGQADMDANIDGDMVGKGSVFSGLGPYSRTWMFKGEDYSNWDFSDELMPDNSAEGSVEGWSSLNQELVNTAVNKDSSVYRTAFLAFPLETIDDLDDRAELLGVFLTWCTSERPPTPTPRNLYLPSIMDDD